MAASPRSPPHAALNSITVAAPSLSSPSPPSSSSSIPVKRPLESSTASSVTTAAQTANGFGSSSSSTSSVSSSQLPSSVATTPPTKKVLERNQACLSCRSRKRKCDGGKPTCGACERLERRCVYSSGGLSTVTKIHSSSSYHKTTTASSTAAPSSRWPPATPSSSSTATASTTTTPTEDSHTLLIHGPPPRTAQQSTPSPTVLTVAQSAQGASLAPSASAQSTFTPINQGSTSPAGTVSSYHHHVPSRVVDDRRSSYEPPAKRQAIATELYLQPPHHNHHSHNPGTDASSFTAQFLQASPFTGLDTPDYSSWSDVSSDRRDSPRETPESTLSYHTDDDLPSPETLYELVDAFFEQIHVFIPCLYRKQVFADIAPGGPLAKPTALTYAMMALAAYVHPDPAVHKRAQRWHVSAKQCFDAAVTRGQYSLHNVQASIYICLYCFVTAEMSELWVFLAKAYRMCNPLGLHQIDSPRRNRFAGFLPHPKSEQDLEERRRAAWGVYVLNVFLSYSTGWPLVINDRDFCVNFPVDEDVFQSGEIEKMSHIVIEPFPHNLEDLISPSSPTTPPRSPYHYIHKLSVLLSRIASHSSSPLPPSAAETESLSTTLARFRLALPRKYRSAANLPPGDLVHVTQLNLLLHVCTILLHPTPPPVSPTSSSANENSTAEFEPTESAAYSAVANILSLLKSVVNTGAGVGGVDALQNPFIASALFLAGRILVGRWVEGGKEEKGVRAEIELVLAVFGRLMEVWPVVAGGWRGVVVRELGRGG